MPKIMIDQIDKTSSVEKVELAPIEQTTIESDYYFQNILPQENYDSLDLKKISESLRLE